ncbi:TVP38/TMEM64 family protein [Brachybacterium sp. AOP3-A1-3]|uniref:TVP38/TMEM64 family protein n=1 Tax=Brachybacterium sp. AOP3-A1-3 TaxID=3457699 RepID=UPI00403470F1
MSTTTQPMQLTPLAPTISTLTGRSTTTDRAPARTPATAAAAASAAASDGATATATAGARTGASTRDPVRIAARLSPLLGLGISIALVWWGLQTGVLQSLENLQAFITSLGAWGPVAFLIASTASVIFPIVPGGLLVIAGPVLFGPVEGTVYNFVAVSTGSLLNFLIARHVGLALIERIFPAKTVEKFLGWTRSNHFTRAFALAIALPVAPDDLLCYIAGTTRMRWRTFVLIILLCKPWALIAYGLGVSALILRYLPW